MITFTGYLLSIKSIDGRAENGVVLVGIDYSFHHLRD